jgi:hypothetical protein
MVLGALGLVLTSTGSGRLSVDHLLTREREEARQPEAVAA